MNLQTGLATLVLALFTSTPAPAASWLEMNFYLSGPRYDGVLPACDNSFALGTIASRFAEKEATFWVSPLSIQGFGDVRETAYRPWARDTIPRRFCSARVLVSDGRETVVHYSIGEDTGFAGGAWGVEWCVVGYDRNLAYSPRCKMARP
jgi:hypothetical protein